MVELLAHPALWAPQLLLPPLFDLTFGLAYCEGSRAVTLSLI